MRLVAIDALHFLPETLWCSEQVQQKYGRQALWKLPMGVSSREEFIATCGDCEDMDSADFEFVSRVEPPFSMPCPSVPRTSLSLVCA